MMTAPALQIRNCIVDFLRLEAGAFSLPVLPDQIRGMLDLSGTPKGLYGITVSAEDLGDHAGNTGRILVDIKPSITIWSHLEEDADGYDCNTLVSDVLAIMQDITYGLDGWNVAWNGNWTVSDTGITDSFRQVVLTATIPIIRQ